MQFIEYSLIYPVSRVDEFLKLNFKATNSKIKKYFDKSFLKRSFEKHATLILPLNFLNEGIINPDYIGPAIEIIYEDSDFLVMQKPENVFVHPLSYDEKNNCLSFLRTRRPELLNINLNHYDRGLLYRLDFETSGVLVYVKSADTLQLLRENFNSIAKMKKYHCVVEGQCQLQGKFNHYFYSSGIKGKKIVVLDNEKKNEKGSIGEFSINPVSYDLKSNTTLMEVDLKSGLRHQIRAQLSHLGFPIRGDLLYGGKSSSRLYLDAFNYQLEFKNKLYSFLSRTEINSWHGK